jgi:hypothetical protein
MAPLRGWGRAAPNRIGALGPSTVRTTVNCSASAARGPGAQAERYHKGALFGPLANSRGFAKLKHLPRKAARGPSKTGGHARLDLFSPGESGNGPASAGYASYENIKL